MGNSPPHALQPSVLEDADGRRPVFGDTKRFQTDPAWHDLLPFYEYVHGDNGAGLGASHQTGWTGLVADLIASRPPRPRPRCGAAPTALNWGPIPLASRWHRSGGRVARLGDPLAGRARPAARRTRGCWQPPRPLLGLLIAALAIAYVVGTGHPSPDVLFSGQATLGPLLSGSASYSVGALVPLFACKGLATQRR